MLRITDLEKFIMKKVHDTLGFEFKVTFAVDLSASLTILLRSSDVFRLWFSLNLFQLIPSISLDTTMELEILRLISHGTLSNEKKTLLLQQSSLLKQPKNTCWMIFAFVAVIKFFVDSTNTECVSYIIGCFIG